ncbi:NAD(P)H-hydrate dehydratase [Bombilactobacillus thymidiniphilus]|uniref:ADP-dependent (S)-NAD(P)H-hydrate dehydratase n=1 Tax=Bombilactobacillus thymidiniphilus TaxID=2923363 RepID=A0ABY4PDL3_9LACO|nr:NAD(P)H-hydrate dehydratase [Bombilactobacillus thymidiniphilus]UQS83863.1 NAD(P)H-hydrate dehydratase [Bombilactobacillus thymidiniphilus]
MKQINSTILQVIKKRPRNSYKGTFGKVLLVAGDAQYGGAALMASGASVYAGAGLVTLATDPSNFTSLRSNFPEVMTQKLSDHKKILDLAVTVDVIAIGPGLAISATNEVLIKQLLQLANSRQTIILDASAFTLLQKQKQVLKTAAANLVLTPHVVEWQRLSDLDIAQQTHTNNLAILQQLTPPQTFLFLKGAPSHLYDNRQQTVVQNTKGTPAMATGGMGDTLTGIIAGFVAQFGFSASIVASAVFTHSYLAEELAQDRYVVLPSMIIQHLPQFMKRWEN